MLLSVINSWLPWYKCYTSIKNCLKLKNDVNLAYFYAISAPVGTQEPLNNDLHMYQPHIEKSDSSEFTTMVQSYIYRNRSN